MEAVQAAPALRGVADTRPAGGGAASWAPTFGPKRRLLWCTAAWRPTVDAVTVGLGTPARKLPICRCMVDKRSTGEPTIAGGGAAPDAAAADVVPAAADASTQAYPAYCGDEAAAARRAAVLTASIIPADEVHHEDVTCTGTLSARPQLCYDGATTRHDRTWENLECCASHVSCDQGGCVGRRRRRF